MKRSLYALTLLMLSSLAAGSMSGATFNIAAGDVPGLISAINTANGNTQDDTIILALSTYSLTSALPLIGADSGHKLVIQGNGATIARSVAANFRIFTTQSGSNVSISGLTISNGNPGAAHGGAIYANFQETAASTLTIDSCTFLSNSGDYGGAIFNDGFNDPSFPAHTATLTVTNSTFSGNTASQYGGAIWNESGGIVMNVSNCTFSQNTAVARSAGAIQFDGSAGTATGSIINCTFSQNTAANFGGAVNVDGAGGFNGNGDPTNGSAILSISNCTFDQNSASSGGAVALDGSNGTSSTGNATVSVSSCTFSDNSAPNGSAIYLSETTGGTTVLHIGNTILATTVSGANFVLNNISGGTVTVTSHGYNLSDDNGAGVLTATGDQINTDPLFDPAGLKDNGGLTATIALQSTSPAIDHGKSNTIFGNNADQRGEFRPFDDPGIANATGGDGSDIGAYEADVRGTAESRSGTTLTFSFLTILGHTYEIQSRPSLTSGTWTTVPNTTPAPPIAGTGGIVTVTVPNAIGTSAGFYRAHQL